MAKKRVIISPALEDLLSTVGENIKLARLRRKITATMLAERAGISRVTLRKVENGESSVTMAIYANVLFCLGLEKDLLRLAGDDPLGRRLQDAELTHTTERVAKRKK
ncbi:helix-turn-helix domain-containing protein [Desulfotignum phosphitoxidans]|uniref:Toxin-antitoxin system, antitoxin component, Xre family n=1 Tax=Desulfotignum phosphitoxidans DSM 13687 TaxID=1286635 RepID=S0G7B0_9BACT|nr:helix-turn-helix transcriptional regulator [Desulfotignum phosphitoxidans]EMS80711.1 toxin-antitoxin system, antitoxin component, Xre family [Desulfotignum phosphitoxidans DSM 13687]